MGVMEWWDRDAFKSKDKNGGDTTLETDTLTFLATKTI